MADPAPPEPRRDGEPGESGMRDGDLRDGDLRDGELRERLAELRAYADGLSARLVRAPEGALAHPYLEPGAGYESQLWDWDAFFTATALTSRGTGHAAARGCVDNFLGRIRDDGSLPFQVVADPAAASVHPRSVQSLGRVARPRATAFNSAKPVLAQLALLGAGDAAGDGTADGAGTGGTAWVERIVEPLIRHVMHWAQTQLSMSHGLFTWRSHRGCGPDNHPAVYGRPQDSVLGLDLNCLFVREYEALADLCDRAGQRERAADLRTRAAHLAARVRDLLWDPVDGLFHYADVLSSTPPDVRQDVTWVTPLRYRAWTAFYPLWAGVASPEQAERTVRAALADGGLFAPYGIRTLSSREPLHHLTPTGNPSNWQGPVWIVANYVVWRGLRHYGYVDLARQLADATVRLLSDDLRAHGHFHECYDPDTGRGLTNPGFLGWNLLGLTMHGDGDTFPQY